MPTEGVYESFGEEVAAEIRAVLARRRMSGRDLARLLNREQSWVSRRLSGATPMTTNDLDEITASLGITIAELMLALPSVRRVAQGSITARLPRASSSDAGAAAQVIALHQRRPAVAHGYPLPTRDGEHSAGAVPLTVAGRVEHHAPAA